MIRFVVRRLLALIPLLFFVAFGAFVLVRLAPGDYLSELSLNPQISPETISALRDRYGLDRPWYLQFGVWLWYALHGNLGFSVSCQCPVTTLISQRLLNTVFLAVAGLGLALLIAIPLGVISAGVRWRWLDRVIGVTTSIVISLPSFLWAILAIIFAATTAWFPVGGIRSLDSERLTVFGSLTDFAHHLVLPAAVIALKQVPPYLRQLNASLREILVEEYITVARAKGLGERSILIKHALKNALNPLITMFGQSLGSLLSGAFVVEVIMSWPGIGSLAVGSLLGRDLNTLVACLLFAAVLLALGNLLADLLLAAFDPRIRQPSRRAANGSDYGF